MQAIDRPADSATTASRRIGRRLSLVAPEGSAATRDVGDLIARLLAAAEASVPGTSHAAARRRVLRQLDRRGPLTLAELPRAWPVTPQHLAYLVRELEQDGLVESEKQHGRRARYRITANGREALRGMRVLQMELLTKLLDAATREDEARTHAAFARLREALGSRTD